MTDLPPSTASPGIALQLYTLREPARENLRETLGRVRDMGWEYVQWSGMPDLPAETIRQTLDEAGLSAVSAHVDVKRFETDFAEQVRFWKQVGVRDVAPGGMMEECRDSLEAWNQGAQRLETLGAQLRKAELRLSYHNHAFEFETFPGNVRCKEDILLESTSPQNLYAEFDTAWIHVGGHNPATYLEKYRGRCPVIHVKDLASAKDKDKPQFTPLGRGILDWPTIFAAGHEAGVAWYIYEQDTCEGSPFECARISFEFLKQHVL